jgi:hypothetical protein
MPDTLLILHVKGTEAETAALPRAEVRAAISQGQLSHSQLIWCPAENVWRQVREMPHLWPSQRIAPAPRPVPRIVEQVTEQPEYVAEATEDPGYSEAEAPVETDEQPDYPVADVPSETDEQPSHSIPRIASGDGVPRVRMAAVMPTVRARAETPVHAGLELEPKYDFAYQIARWLCVGMGVLVLLVVLANYSMIDRPLNHNLEQTRYAKISVYGHLGAFLQPNVLVIHIPPSAAITPANMLDFLATLARNTPRDPIATLVFERVALTPGWKVQYSFSGVSWTKLGTIPSKGDQRLDYLMSQLDNASGEPLLKATTLNQATRNVQRDRLWNAFVAQFMVKS